MKKILAVVLVVISIVSCLSACTLDTDTPTKEVGNTTTKTEKVSKDETYSLNETAVFDNLKIVATEIKKSKGDSLWTPEAGNVFVGVKFTIKNISDEEQTISSLLLFDAYADDEKCDYSVSAACAFGDYIDGTIAPGKKTTGWYAIEVPKNWKTLEMHVKANWLSGNSAKFVFSK